MYRPGLQTIHSTEHIFQQLYHECVAIFIMYTLLQYSNCAIDFVHTFSIISTLSMPFLQCTFSSSVQQLCHLHCLFVSYRSVFLIFYPDTDLSESENSDGFRYKLILNMAKLISKGVIDLPLPEEELVLPAAE